MIDSRLQFVRAEAAFRRSKFMYMTLALLASAIGLSWASVRYLDAISPPDPVEVIGALKVSVLERVNTVATQSESGIRKSFKCAERLQFDPLCREKAAEAIDVWRGEMQAYQRDITELARYGVTFDATLKNFSENYGKDSPLNVERMRDLSKGLDVLKIIAGPIIFLLITWMNTFFIKQYMRYDSLLFALQTIETDRALKEIYAKDARLLDALL